jgi:hypothetical protein
MPTGLFPTQICRPTSSRCFSCIRMLLRKLRVESYPLTLCMAPCRRLPEHDIDKTIQCPALCVPRQSVCLMNMCLLPQSVTLRSLLPLTVIGYPCDAKKTTMSSRHVAVHSEGKLSSCYVGQPLQLSELKWHCRMFLRVYSLLQLFAALIPGILVKIQSPISDTVDVVVSTVVSVHTSYEYSGLLQTDQRFFLSLMMLRNALRASFLV